MQTDIDSSLIGINHLAEVLGSSAEQFTEYYQRTNCSRCRSVAAALFGSQICAIGSPSRSSDAWRDKSEPPRGIR